MDWFYQAMPARLSAGAPAVGACEEQRCQGDTAWRHSEVLYRSIVSTSPDGFWLVDTQGRILEVNQAYCRLSGYTHAELLGMSISDLEIMETPEETAAHIQRIIAAGFDRFETHHRCKDGSLLDVEVIACYLPLQGGLFVCFTRDITARKQAEEERLEMERRLLHAQRLESLGVMAGGMAHDFNNLLMIILGNLDLAVAALSPASTAYSSIEQAIHAAQRAADLTRQMLAYSGKGRFVIKALDLTELVEENIQFFKPVIPNTVTLDLVLDQTLPPVRADAGQVQQIIMNLITNAAESIGDQTGAITVTTGVELCDVACLRQSRLEEKPLAGEFVYLQVADTGCGMDEETRRRLFDPFFTTKFTGRGLGLSAVLGIVRGHGGTIFVDSELDRGTTVKVLFPVAAPA